MSEVPLYILPEGFVPVAAYGGNEKKLLKEQNLIWP